MILGAFAGFFLGLFVGLDLFLFGILPLNSIVLTILPVVGLVLGIVIGRATPIGRGSPKTPI